MSEDGSVVVCRTCGNTKPKYKRCCTCYPGTVTGRQLASCWGCGGEKERGQARKFCLTCRPIGAPRVRERPPKKMKPCSRCGGEKDEEQRNYRMCARCLRMAGRKHRRFGCINTRLRAGLKRKTSRGPRVLLAFLGYSLDELQGHIERQFTRGMTWDRFMAGEIHLDHIVPVAAFNIDKPADVRACWALTNLRPLWARQNISKSATRAFLV